MEGAEVRAIDLAVELADYGVEVQEPTYARVSTTWSTGADLPDDATCGGILGGHYTPACGRQPEPSAARLNYGHAMQRLGSLDELQAGGFNRPPDGDSGGSGGGWICVQLDNPLLIPQGPAHHTDPNQDTIWIPLQNSDES